MDEAALSNTDRGATGPDTPAETEVQHVLTREEMIRRVRAYHPRVKSELLGSAYDFAKQHHGEQLRASGDAYYSHPVAVASLLVDTQMDEVTIVAGLLHDVVEDTDISIAEIEFRFGSDVAELVDGVTKLDKLKYDSKEAAQAENFQKFILATINDLRVLLVKLADRLHNMRTIKHLKKEERRQRIARETMDIYAPLARRVGLYSVAAELEDLSFEQINQEARRAIQFRLEELSSENADDLERIRGDLIALMDIAGIECRIKGRRKQPYSVWRKLEKKSISFRDVADIFAFRLVVKDVADCYKVLGEVHTLWACLPDRFRDFISVPKPNGYASLHTTVRASGNRRVELQIRTEDMDRTAEFGVAAHWGYKNRNYGFDLESARAAGLDPEANLMAFAQLLHDGADADEFMEFAKLEMYRDHVFAFSPKGKLIILPQGAMPLDFAYAVHSAVGDTCIGARVNGETRPLRHELKNGDVVDIVRGQHPNPLPGWDALVITGRARSAIRRLVKGREATEFKSLGEGLIHMALRRAGIDPVDVKLNHVAVRAGFDDREDMAEAVGRGEAKSVDVVEAAFPGHKAEPLDVEGKTPLDNQTAPLFVAGQELTPGITLHLGECCHPLPGDRIMGVQVAGKGVVVHIASCSMLADYDDQPDLWVDLKWTELAKTGAVAVGRIRINAANERGVLAKLCTAVAQANGNITRISTDHRQPDFIALVMDIEVEDLKRLTQILAALRSLAVVDRVVRDQERSNDT
jgi:RelA/SpoT family (p)ppGpp synthetase